MGMSDMYGRKGPFPALQRPGLLKPRQGAVPKKHVPYPGHACVCYWWRSARWFLTLAANPWALPGDFWLRESGADLQPVGSVGGHSASGGKNVSVKWQRTNSAPPESTNEKTEMDLATLEAVWSFLVTSSDLNCMSTKTNRETGMWRKNSAGSMLRFLSLLAGDWTRFTDKLLREKNSPKG